MKFHPVLCALTLTLISPTVTIRSANAQNANVQQTELSASEILQKSLKTYGELQTYKGTCAVTNEQITAFGDTAPQHHVGNARATFRFKRGERLSIEGENVLGDPFKALSTLDRTWIESPAKSADGVPMTTQQREAARQILPALEDSERFDEVTDALFSLTHGAASVVPTLLMGDSPSNPLNRPPGATLLPDQKIVGADCYVVRHDFAAASVITTFWVDKQTFLLRRMQQEQSTRFGDGDKNDSERRDKPVHFHQRRSEVSSCTKHDFRAKADSKDASDETLHNRHRVAVGVVCGQLP